MTSRRGTALLLVLTVITTIATLGVLANESARESVAAANNRVALTRERWLAEGCAAEELARLERWLAEAPMTRWHWLDSTSAVTGACAIGLRPRGLTLDVNRASAAQISASLQAAGVRNVEANALAEAIVDWRDLDDLAGLTNTSEKGWYLREGRVPPRNGPFAAVEELELVRGALATPGLEYLGVDDGLVVLSRAPAPVLAGLPGMSVEEVEVVVAARSESPFPDVATIAARLGDDARARLYRELHLLVQQSVAAPETWLMTVRVAVRPDGPQFVLELLLARDGERIAVVRRRTWP